MTALARAIEAEWRASQAARAGGDLDTAFRHLERAHILSQRLTARHVRTHAAMWAVGWQRRDLREVAGQSARIVAALLFSRIWVPLGNTGGADVSAFAPMAVPEDLSALLAEGEQR